MSSTQVPDTTSIRSRYLLIGGFIFWIFSQTAWGENQPEQRIGNISFDAEDIFDLANPSESKWLYRAANKLHIQTNESFIRRELLFKEGDAYDPKVIAETERNLRNYNFIRRARIESVPQPDGTVNIIVHTKDTWTLEPQVDFSRVGGENRSKSGIVERNLLGTGQSVSAFYTKSAGRTGPSLSYKDPQFLHQRLELDGSYLKGIDYRLQGFSLSKPFYSSTAQQSWQASHYFEEQELPLIDNGIEQGRFEKETRTTTVGLGRSLRSSTSLSRHVVFSFQQETTDYDTVSNLTQNQLSPDRDLSIFSVGFDRQRLNFIQERHIQKFDRDEDYNMGTEFNVNMGVGRDWEGQHLIEAIPSLGGQIGHSWGPGHFGLARASYKSRFDKLNTYNLVASAGFEYYNRITPKQTLAGHMAFDRAHHLALDQLLLLGEDTGLRGYANGQFSGNRRFLMNLEDRLFFKDDALHLISLGGALFFDSGYAWSVGDHNMSLSDLKSSVGIGFRVAPSRSSRNEPIRFDLAYALNNNHQNHRVVFSVQSGLVFGGPPPDTTNPSR